jgi:dTDP-4-dehydrorhamnose 3,5-epimerase
MTMQELEISGVFLVDGSCFPDERGDFRRLLPFACLVQVGFDLQTSYVASAHNSRAGTVRGLHYQATPCGETKAVWCHTGSLYDVLFDARSDSPTRGQWTSVELSAGRPEVIIVPEGVAHGYQTTTPDTGVTYLISGTYAPDHARTIFWRDEALAIPWPLAEATVSQADASATSWQQDS